MQEKVSLVVYLFVNLGTLIDGQQAIHQVERVRSQAMSGIESSVAL